MRRARGGGRVPSPIGTRDLSDHPIRRARRGGQVPSPIGTSGSCECRPCRDEGSFRPSLAARHRHSCKRSGVPSLIGTRPFCEFRVRSERANYLLRACPPWRALPLIGTNSRAALIYRTPTRPRDFALRLSPRPTKLSERFAVAPEFSRGREQGR